MSMYDPHYDGGHSLTAKVYYDGYDNGSSNFKNDTCGYQQQTYLYSQGWKNGYEDHGKAAEAAMKEILRVEIITR